MSNDWESELGDALLSYEYKLITNNLPEPLARYIMDKMATDKRYWEIVQECAENEYWDSRIDQIADDTHQDYLDEIN